MQDADGPVTSYQRARVLYRDYWRPALSMVVDALAKMRDGTIKVRVGFDKFFGMER